MRNEFFLSMITPFLSFYLLVSIISTNLGDTVFAESSAKPSGQQEEATGGQIVPDTGELPPAPELTPEERERLMKGTRIKVSPEPCCSDGEHPCLPDDPGRKKDQ